MEYYNTDFALSASPVVTDWIQWLLLPFLGAAAIHEARGTAWLSSFLSGSILSLTVRGRRAANDSPVLPA